MHGGSGGSHGHAVPATLVGGETLLEGGDFGAGSDPAPAEAVHNPLDFRLAYGGSAEHQVALARPNRRAAGYGRSIQGRGRNWPVDVHKLILAGLVTRNNEAFGRVSTREMAGSFS